MAIDDLKNFFINLEKISFFDRLFKWKAIRNNFIPIYDEIKELEDQIKKIEILKNELEIKRNTIQHNEKYLEELKLNLKQEEYKLDQINQKNSTIEKNNSQLLEKANALKESKIKLDFDVNFYKEKIEDIQNKNKILEKRIIQFEQIKEEQQQKYDDMILRSNAKEEAYEKRRTELENREKEKETLRFEEMKKTWKIHEDDVEKRIREICQYHIIEYVNKEDFPDKGKPDNCIKIMDEYVIFDAKSPHNDDLTNFPKYIKEQTESVKKYAKLENVKKEIFLVVPTNTIDKITKTYYNMSEYDVYIITKNSIEPIILSLKKIENYELADKLSPPDRDKICRVIGRFAHSTKRRLQIDNFFAHEYISLLENCETLPEDILETSVDYEKGTKLNPPREDRKKIIAKAKLNKDSVKIQKNLEIYNLNTKINKEDMEKIKLYEKEESESLDVDVIDS